MTIAMPADCRRPNLFSSLREFGTPLEFLRFPGAIPSLLDVPRGDGRSIILLPGYQSPEIAMRPLAIYLNAIGYRAETWGLGVNTGNVDGLAESFGARLVEISEVRREPITVIGWSLGGVIARETARLNQDHVREIVTLGTPLIGGPKYTSVGAVFARQNGIDLDEFEKYVHEINSLGLPQPITSIYSKSDGVVGWKAAIDVYNPQARNIEIRSTHFGLGTNSRAWKIIAETLGAS